MQPGRRQRSSNALPASACGADDTRAPFTRSGPSLRQALTAHGLLVYAPAFERAEIDAELAQTMTAADVRALLPDAPLGDCLRMQVMFQEALQRQPVIPASAGWRLPATVLANGQISGTLMEKYGRWCDNVMIISSLMLSLAVEGWRDAPNECADGTPCETWLKFDYMVWSIAVGSLFMAAFAAFMGSAFLPQLLRDEDAPVFVLDNWFLYSFPGFITAIGIVSICVGHGTRALITLDDAKGTVGLTAMGVCITSMFAFFYRIIMRVTGTPLSELILVHLSFWGLPLGRCDELQCRDLARGQAEPLVGE